MTSLRVILAVLMLAGAVGCSTLPASIPSRKPLPKVVTLVWSKDFDRSAVAAWEAQIVSRWPKRDVVAVFCHGSDAKPWSMTPDRPLYRVPTENVAALLHGVFPDRLIVLVSCNGSASAIHTPGVAYARKRIWIQPGCDTRFSLDDMGIVSDAGNVREFEVTK